MTIRHWLPVVAALTLLCAAGSPRGQDDARIEFHWIETVTLKTQQVLTGDPSGEHTKITGELWMPTADADKFPAVVLVHGSGGVHASIECWAEELNSIGVAAFILDSFRARGISSTVNDQSQLDSLASWSMPIARWRSLRDIGGLIRAVSP
jgi:predicted dienelactone hydrolase